MNDFTRPVWVEINLDNLRFNFRQLKKNISKNTKMMAIVKANAYGHGAMAISRVLVDEGVDRLGVALPEEGVELREAGYSLPIHVLGEILPEQHKLILDYDLIPTISRGETLENLNKMAESKDIRKKVHIKIDTGMGRLGLHPDDAVEFIKYALDLSNIEIEGLMTHFATADEKNKEYTYLQWERFNYVIRQLEEMGIEIPLKHAGNSATLLDLSEYQLNMLRPGIVLYGLLPSEQVKSIELKPVLSWKARIDFLKEVPSGTPISYGATYVADKKSIIATVPLGYGDGYSRFLSNKGYVLINGQKAAILGRVCMDQFMIDVTEIPDVEVGNELVLIGEQKSNKITATELAELIGTINYEVLCNISLRVPRKYISSSVGGIINYDRKGNSYKK